MKICYPRKQWSKEEVNNAIQMRKNGYKFKNIGILLNRSDNAVRKAMQRYWNIYKQNNIYIPSRKVNHIDVNLSYIKSYGQQNNLWQHNMATAMNIYYINQYRSQNLLPMFQIRY